MHANTRAYTRTNRTNIVFFCEICNKTRRWMYVLTSRFFTAFRMT